VKKTKKIAIITARLIETPQAYENKTNSDIEKEITENIPTIPYVAEIEKVTVLEYPPT
jgi:hypothetical protein